MSNQVPQQYQFLCAEAKLAATAGPSRIQVFCLAPQTKPHAEQLEVKEYQPVKLAAMEGLWETTRGAPLLLFAIPDEEARPNHY